MANNHNTGASDDSVWLVLPVTPVPSHHESRVYANYEAVRRDWSKAPAAPDTKLLSTPIAQWFETSWAEPGDRVLFQAIQLPVKR